jgi:hypothetical protein
MSFPGPTSLERALSWQGRSLAASTAFLSPSQRWPLIQSDLADQLHLADTCTVGSMEKPPTMAEIRSAQAFASRSAVGAFKLICILHADQLSAETANALLKLVEEPPPGLYVVLLAAVDRFLPTLRSRLSVVSDGVAVAEGTAAQWATILSSLDLADPAQRQLASQLLFWYPLVHTGVRSGTVLDAF